MLTLGVACCDASGMSSASSQLAAVQTAIDKLLSGAVQAYQIGPRSFTYLDIGKLFDERRRLEIQAARETTGIAHVAKMGRTSR